ncbi:hypothetical protein SISNIDRAFT_485211 [Sistotremastrum niveocremeum HHB9708]|uniref:RRM domain-containing protein n=1 Tax=Sistotremastrum niveocremeum HHB9708 TaxID=1314777 RepID=A0A164UW89_9AGAM|nr:hypothetical protein SISNIDRAFT_485211 [Sistotremastrum niveocremeum HHB9708]
MSSSKHDHHAKPSQPTFPAGSEAVVAKLMSQGSIRKAIGVNPSDANALLVRAPSTSQNTEYNPPTAISLPKEQKELRERQNSPKRRRLAPSSDASTTRTPNDTSCKLLVGGIPPELSHIWVSRLLRACGAEGEDIDFKPRKKPFCTNKFLEHGFASFEQPKSMLRAIQLLNGLPLPGFDEKWQTRKLTVKPDSWLEARLDAYYRLHGMSQVDRVALEVARRSVQRLHQSMWQFQEVEKEKEKEKERTRRRRIAEATPSPADAEIGPGAPPSSKEAEVCLGGSGSSSRCHGTEAELRVPVEKTAPARETQEDGQLEPGNGSSAKDGASDRCKEKGNDSQLSPSSTDKADPNE